MTDFLSKFFSIFVLIYMSGSLQANASATAKEIDKIQELVSRTLQVIESESIEEYHLVIADRSDVQYFINHEIDTYNLKYSKSINSSVLNIFINKKHLFSFMDTDPCFFYYLIGYRDIIDSFSMLRYDLVKKGFDWKNYRITSSEIYEPLTIHPRNKLFYFDTSVVTGVKVILESNKKVFSVYIDAIAKSKNGWRIYSEIDQVGFIR